MTASHPRPARRWWTLAAIGALTLGACAPGDGGAEPADSSANSSTGISTDVAAAGDVTLTVWDQEVRGGQNEQMTQLNAAFEETYPNVTIERKSQSFDDLAKTLTVALSGNDVPDVVQANNGRSDMGTFVQAGQLTDLTPYADAYGWTDRMSDSILAKTRYSEDGETFGQGNLYGLSQVGEVVGVFYSRAMLQQLGVEVPQTWTDLEDALALAQDNQITPVALGNIEKWPAGHVFGPLQGSHVPPADIQNLAMGNKGSSWLSPENQAAAQQFANWADQGWLGEAPNGTDYDAAWKSFAEGKAAFVIGGSWLAPDLSASMGEDVGFVVPVTAEGEPPRTTGGTGIPFAVPSGSDVPDVAAAYIDFITNEDAMTVLAETGNMPVYNTADLAPESGVNADIYAAFDAVTTDGDLLTYLDWASPTFGDVLGSGLQDLIAGQSTSQQFLEALEADYTENAH